LEYQILDDKHNDDAKKGRDGDRSIGSLYDLIAPPKEKKVMPVGQWNHARILSQGKHVEFGSTGGRPSSLSGAPRIFGSVLPRVNSRR
jgi:hypothetical protein